MLSRIKSQLYSTQSGLQLILVDNPALVSISVVAAVGVGSRYESEKNAGLAHFYEHLTMDGSEKYPDSKSFAEVIEGKGGVINAFTSKEYTCFYFKLASDYWQSAVELMSELLIRPKLSQADIAKEKQIILEEIKMREDTPQIKAHDQLMETLFAGYALGLPGIGFQETVANFGQTDFQNWKKQHYHTGNTVLVISGRLPDFDRLVEYVEQQFADMPVGQASQPEAISRLSGLPRHQIAQRELDQTHVAVGWQALAYQNQQKYALKLIEAVLSAGLSSRLMQEIRQKLGLAYYVGAYSDYYSDTGLFAVKAGLDQSKLELAMSALAEQMRALYTSQPVSQQELAQAKQYVRGKVVLQIDDSLNSAINYAYHWLMQHELLDWQAYLQQIQQVKRDQLIAVAEEIFQPERGAFSLVGQGIEKPVVQKFWQQWRVGK